MPMILPLLLAFAGAPQAAAAAPPAKPTAAQIAEAAPASSWGQIAAEDLLVIDFADGQRGVIWLAQAFAPAHIANIRTIARAGWWQGSAIYRVQDDYVTQWGDPTNKKPVAPGVVLHPPAEYEWPATAHPALLNPYKDAYASVTGFTADGWAVAGDGREQWLPHCYGTVGVGRDLAPDVGNGGELYTVIGHAPRHLDRNIAVVGRVIDGMAAFSARPRGTGEMGFYTDPAQNAPIRRISIASDLPAGERPAYQYLKPTSPEFPKTLEARANRGGPFFTVPAGAADLCNLPVPVRKVPAG